MPVSFSSPARNLFLLGSSGRQVVSNFFESISKASTTDGVFIPDDIRYIADNKKYALSGSAADSNSKGFGWLERQDYNLETGSLTTDYSNRIESTLPGVNLTLRAMELDGNDNLIVVGFSGTSPWIAKYSNDGVLDWQSTTNSANVRYLGVATDSNNNYYACGRTSYSLPDTQAFVEKFDSNGNPGWGKQAFMLGRDVVLEKISANDRGEVVAVGFLEDDSADKGYIVKIDTNTGEVLWDRTLERNISGYGGFVLPSSGNDITPADVKCTACYIDSRNQIYVVGSIDGKGTNDNGVGEFLIKYSPEGNIIWQKERDTTDYISNPAFAPNTVPFDVKSDGETEQTVVLSVDSGPGGIPASIELSKYSKSGDLVFRRRISKGTDQLGAASLDADPSFYYFIFRDQELDGLAGEPDRYTFGKVSTSGNGLGAFQYDDGTATLIDYTISLDTENKIGRLSDGSVTNSVSDLMTYPFTANQVVFDDLATHVSNKKRQMDSADSFEYSGSPAIRPADFQELNLLGDVYSGSGDWLDQSGNGNDAQTSFTTTTTLPGTTESENFASVTSSYSTYGTVVENTVTNDLPFTAAHYSGKVRDLQTGGFRIDLTGNSNASDFFMGCWIKFDTYATSRQMGIDLFGGYVYWETLANGAIAVRHDGGSRADSGATSLNDGNWHHIALSRTGGTLYGFLDGTAVVSTTSGVGGASVNGNENFWFFGGSGTSYNVDAKVLDPFVYAGSGVSSYTVPTAPLIDSDGNINHFSGFSGQEYYISPAISLPGGTTTTTNGPTHNDSGYFEFDGTDDTIDLGTKSLIEPSSSFSIEAWCLVDSLTDECSIYEISANGNPGTIMLSAGSTTDGNVGGRFLVRNSSGQDQGVRDVVNNNLGEWHHYVGVHINNGIFSSTCLYVDGVGTMCQDKIDVPHAFDFTDVGVQHLGLSAGSRYLDGRIGEVRIYPRALTAAQVFQNYNATKIKYINEAPDTAPKISDSPIVYDSNLLLNYDFGNRATYDNFANRFVNPDPINSEIKITASDAAGGDYFGYSVAVGSDRIVVGAYLDDDNGDSSGSAYIFDLDGNQLSKITASDGDIDDYFGLSVAVGSNRIVVGAYLDDDNGSRSGSTYIYDLDGTNEVKITASDGATDDQFGYSVAVGSDRIVVGAYADADNGSFTGSAYIYDLDGTNEVKITASDAAAADYFGYSVAVGSGRIVVGAYGDDDNGSLSGSAYIFDLDGNQLSKITASDGATADRFGYSVAVENNKIVVGAYGDDADNGLFTGSAYIYDLDGTNEVKITASDGAGGDYFGYSVAVGSDRIVVGAYRDDDNSDGSGSAYIYDLDGTNEVKITASDAAFFDTFGRSVAVGSDRIVVGAYLDDDNGGSSGSAYIYNLKMPLPTTVKNLSSTSYTGTINGATFNPAGYFEFDGTNDYIQSSSVMAPGSADFSVVFWYKITNTGGRGGLFERAASPPYSGWVLGQGGDNNWSASVRDSSNNNVAFQYTFPTVDQWTCDAFTWDVSTQTLTPYRNGANAGTATNTGTVGSLDGNTRYPMAIGGRLDSASPQYKPMECGEVQMYSRVLTAAEVLQNFNATRSKYGV